MKFQNYILPVFISSNLIGQNDNTAFNKFDFGFSHSLFTSMSFNPIGGKNFLNQERNFINNANISELQYGFGIGVFLWMPLNDGVVYKPKLEGNFSNVFFKQTEKTFATSFDLSVSQSFAIALKSPDKNGTICLARDMSCYLTSKQPYLLIGPKIGLKKYDKGYIHKGFENEITMGLLVGYGINYEFHGVNFSPEIIYSVSTTTQNKIHDTKKIVHSITLGLNFF